MTNPILSNDISNSRVITWQYDKAINLISLITKWNEWAGVAVRDFWDNMMYNVMTCRIVYPKAKGMWREGVNYTVGKLVCFGDSATEDYKCYRCKTQHISEDANKPPNPSYWEVEEYDSLGLALFGNILGIQRPRITMEDGTKKYISDDLYYRLLRSRFYMLYKSPTITNYNKFLHILFPGKKPDGSIDPIKNRNRVVSFGDCDFQDYTAEGSGKTIEGARGSMSMGFTFPADATDEEAMLIFQHYDICYPFPAAIRSNCSFMQTDLIIGLNDESSGQDYRNFADGFAKVSDAAKNGGILSSTDNANYYVQPTIKGKVYVVPVTTASSSIALSFASGVSGTIWVDWGDGNSNYETIPSGSTMSHSYNYAGRYAIAVYSGDSGLMPTSAPAGTVKTYTLNVNG